MLKNGLLSNTLAQTAFWVKVRSAHARHVIEIMACGYGEVGVDKTLLLRTTFEPLLQAEM